jgi:methylated-DNA-[protein]-cysteine S-methyltransferase
MGQHLSLIDTEIGPLGIAWGDAGIARLCLPEADRAATEARLKRAAPEAEWAEPTPDVAPVVSALQDYAAGGEVDFAFATLDLDGVSPFNREVYDLTRHVGWGRTTSYGELARAVGTPGAARAVGRAMGENPVPIIIPCHRVLASGDKLGGFSAFGGTFAKERLLVLERVRLAL